MKRIWLSFFLLASLLKAAAAGSCPITIDQVKRDTGLGDRNTYCFSFRASNGSGKPVAKVQVGAAAVDSRRDAHVLHYDYVVEKIPAGEAKKGYFSTHRLLGTDYQGVKVWVNRVEFADGAAWTDDGSRACGSEDLSRKVRGTK